MDELKQNLHLLHSLRTLVEARDQNYYNYKIINEHPITDSTISIVMTSHERSQQVYCTLKTINIFIQHLSKIKYHKYFSLEFTVIVEGL